MTNNPISILKNILLFQLEIEQPQQHYGASTIMFISYGTYCIQSCMQVSSFHNNLRVAIFRLISSAILNDAFGLWWWHEIMDNQENVENVYIIFQLALYWCRPSSAMWKSICRNSDGQIYYDIPNILYTLAEISGVVCLINFALYIICFHIIISFV